MTRSLVANFASPYHAIEDQLFQLPLDVGRIYVDVLDLLFDVLFLVG